MTQQRPSGWELDPPSAAGLPSGYPSHPPVFPSGSSDGSASGGSGIDYVHPGRPRTPAARSARPDRRALAGSERRPLTLIGLLCVALFLLCGFVFGGWAWAWLLLVLPALVAVVLTRSRSGGT